MNPTLPSVAGRMEMTHEAFQLACQVALWDLQESLNPDNHLVYLLCEAIRCSREACELANPLPHCKRCGEKIKGVGMMTATLCSLCADDEINGR